MNILHLEASTGWGGQEIRILRESVGMQSAGHRVILGVMKGGKLIDEGCKAGFTCYSLDFRKHHWPITLIQIANLIRRHHIDLVNTHSSLDAWIGGMAAKMMGKAVVRTRHLSTPIKPGLNSKILYGILADVVVTTCSSIIPMICKQSGKSQGRCLSIPTGVDPLKIHYDKDAALSFRTSLGVKKTDFLVGTLCVMRSWKGIGDFLKAAVLLREIKEIKWVIIGGGHEKEYRKMAADLKLDVHFTGHLPNPFTALGALDLFTLLSTANEGVSQAILQAAFLEKPLVATPIGGLCEVCIEGKTGLQVAPFSPPDVARSVLEMKENPARREAFGQRAKALVKEKFTLDRTIFEMEKVYNVAKKKKLP